LIYRPPSKVLLEGTEVEEKKERERKGRLGAEASGVKVRQRGERPSDGDKGTFLGGLLKKYL
jgi:hypothetical protein